MMLLIDLLNNKPQNCLKLCCSQPKKVVVDPNQPTQKSRSLKLPLIPKVMEGFGFL